MRTTNHLQTMALTYQEICQGERPWVALGNFMNDWFDYAKDRRTQLVVDPIFLPESPNSEALRWAAFCTASVEWLCFLLISYERSIYCAVLPPSIATTCPVI
jgi:hypothetical protein